MNRNYKNIIPNLVSFDTTLKSIVGFRLSDNFDFYNSITNKNRFHYKIRLDNNIRIPNEYIFRSGYYLKSGDDWYYERKILGIVLKFKFSPNTKTFVFNNLYSKIPFEIGGILPAGKHISDFIILDLFLHGINVFGGCAIEYDEKKVGIITPGMNGKTTFINQLVKQNKLSKYIAEDIFICNFDKMISYPTMAYKHKFARNINNELCNNIKNIEKHTDVFKIDNIYLVQNFTEKIDNKIKNKYIMDYLSVCSLYFLNNNFVRAYITNERMMSKIMQNIKNIEKHGDSCTFIKIYNFNFDVILNNKQNNES
jgi:hypothetical protein